MFADDAPIALNVDENTAADTPIGSTYTATDDDGDTLTYSLDEGDGAAFEIDSSGQIKTKNDLDHEAKETYNVNVSVTDGRNDAGDDEQTPIADASIDVTISVTDVDEEGTITFSSDNPAAGTALTATLDDDDAPISGETFQWAISNESGILGQILLAMPHRPATRPRQDDVDDYLRVTATYTDSFDANKTATDATGQVQDRPHTNENPVLLKRNDNSFRRREHRCRGEHRRARLSATHADDGKSVRWCTLIGGTDAASFDIEATYRPVEQPKLVLPSTSRPLRATPSPSRSATALDDYSNTDTTVGRQLSTVTITVTNIDRAQPCPGAPNR